MDELHSSDLVQGRAAQAIQHTRANAAVSTTVKCKAPTPRKQLQQRGAEATRTLREILHLKTDFDDTTILGTALAEAAATELRRNTTFAEDIRRHYYELQNLREQRGGQGQHRKEPLPPLEPLEQRAEGPTTPIDPYAPPDPERLVRIYGKQQLERALQDYTVDQLKRTAAIYEQRHDGARPTNRGRRDALIAYIVEWYDKEHAS